MKDRVMRAQDEIVAIALLTQENVRGLGATLKRVFFIDQRSVFGDLIKALDAVEGAGIPNAAGTDE